jgi:hypothetical protein
MFRVMSCVSNWKNIRTNLRTQNIHAAACFVLFTPTAPFNRYELNSALRIIYIFYGNLKLFKFYQYFHFPFGCPLRTTTRQELNETKSSFNLWENINGLHKLVIAIVDVIKSFKIKNYADIMSRSTFSSYFVIILNNFKTKTTSKQHTTCSSMKYNFTVFLLQFSYEI